MIHEKIDIDDKIESDTPVKIG